MFIPSIGRRHSFTPIRLGAVCSRWRHVGWNSPWVWSKLSLTGCWILEPRFPLVKNTEHLSPQPETMTLDLTINCFHDFDYDMKNRLTHEDVFNTIFVENQEKLRVLGLGTWPEECQLRLEKVQETTMFSQLEGLWINCPDGVKKKLLLTNAPHLRKVELVGVRESAIIIFRGLKSYTSHYPTFPPTSLKIFTQCINLEYFQCSKLLTASGRGTNIVRDSINFPHLKFFCCLDYEIPVSYQFHGEESHG